MQNKTHHLKCEQPYFSYVESGVKTFELRRDDRGFLEGDTVVLEEVIWKDCDANDPHMQSLCKTRKTITKKINYIVRNKPEYGLMPGFCILALVNV